MNDVPLTALITGLLASVPAVLGLFQGRGIHKLVNSNLTKVKADLDLALERVERLEILLTKKNVTQKEIHKK